MRWYTSIRCLLLSPLTVPLASPLPRCSPCNAGLPADHQSFTNWLPQTSPASMTLTPQLVPQGPDLPKGGKQLSQGSAHAALPALPASPFQVRAPPHHPLQPPLSQHCAADTRPSVCPPHGNFSRQALLPLITASPEARPGPGA